MSEVNPLKPSERMRIPRQAPLEQAADARVHNFLEVPQGFTGQRAREASPEIQPEGIKQTDQLSVLPECK